MKQIVVLLNLFRVMFVNFRFSTMKIKVSHYLNRLKNLVFQFAIANFYLFKPRITKHGGCLVVLNGALAFPTLTCVSDDFPGRWLLT